MNHEIGFFDLMPVVIVRRKVFILCYLFGDSSRLRVFENRILRRLFGPKRDENGKWRMLHNEELHSVYCSPNIVRVIKSRRLRWAGHVARIGEVGVLSKF